VEVQGNPVVKVRTEHCISRKMIDPDALTVLYRLKHGGYTAYLVGGAVRDLLMGRTPKDFDVGTDAHPRDIKRLFRNCFLIGRRFRLAHIRFGTKVIETCTFRKEPPPGTIPETVEAETSVHHHENTFGTPEEDAHRRDFTINGLFYDIRTFSVIDYVGGLQDLEKRVVRCIGDPDVRYREDPVRMLRAIRFSTRFGFSIDNTTLAAISRNSMEINKASTARLLEEIYRLFYPGCVAATFRLLQDEGLFHELFADVPVLVKEAAAADSGFWRHLNALDCLARAGQVLTPDVMLGALFGDAIRRRTAELGPTARTGAMMEAAAEVLTPFFAKYHAPRAVFYRLVHAFGNMMRMERESDPTRCMHLLGQEWTGLALVLIRMAAEAEGRDGAAIMHAWEELHMKHPERHGDHRSFRRRRPRRGHRGNDTPPAHVPQG